MRYVIMADGAGSRWDNYNEIPKHFVKINEETLLERTVRLVKKQSPNSEVIITSRDSRYEVLGARRHEPKNNVLEIDRFTYELIEDDVCFLYGDTVYTDEIMEVIVNTTVSDIMFYGNQKSIIAVKVKNSKLFKKHVDIVKKQFLNGEIDKCIGWQVYQSYTGQTFDNREILNNKYCFIDKVYNINTPDDFNKITKTREL